MLSVDLTLDEMGGAEVRRNVRPVDATAGHLVRIPVSGVVHACSRKNMALEVCMLATIVGAVSQQAVGSGICFFSHPPHSECQHSRTPVVGACSWAFPMGVANDFLSLLRCFPSNPAVRDTNFNSLSLLWLVHVAVCRSLDGFCFHCCGMSREGTVEDVCTLLIYGGCLHVPLLALHSPVEISNPDCAVLWLQVLSCFPFTVL